MQCIDIAHTIILCLVIWIQCSPINLLWSLTMPTPTKSNVITSTDFYLWPIINHVIQRNGIILTSLVADYDTPEPHEDIFSNHDNNWLRTCLLSMPRCENIHSLHLFLIPCSSLNPCWDIFPFHYMASNLDYAHPQGTWLEHASFDAGWHNMALCLIWMLAGTLSPCSTLMRLHVSCLFVL